MDSVAVAERVERIVAVRDDASASDDLIESGLIAVREVQAWADAQHAALVAKLSPDPISVKKVFLPATWTPHEAAMPSALWMLPVTTPGRICSSWK